MTPRTAAAVLMALLSAVLVGFVISRRTHLIAETAAELASGNFGARVPIEGTGDGFDHLRQQMNLMAERIGELWLQVQTESLGPAFEFTPEYRVFWAYVPHFVHSPFYVYAYAFGDCLVNALYAVFQSGHPGFQQKYLDMLRAGGTKRHKELLAPFGLDATDPAFWRKGLDIIAGFIDELEQTA